MFDLREIKDRRLRSQIGRNRTFTSSHRNIRDNFQSRWIEPISLKVGPIEGQWNAQVIHSSYFHQDEIFSFFLKRELKLFSVLSFTFCFFFSAISPKNMKTCQFFLINFVYFYILFSFQLFLSLSAFITS